MKRKMRCFFLQARFYGAFRQKGFFQKRLPFFVIGDSLFQKACICIWEDTRIFLGGFKGLSSDSENNKTKCRNTRAIMNGKKRFLLMNRKQNATQKESKSENSTDDCFCTNEVLFAPHAASWKKA